MNIIFMLPFPVFYKHNPMALFKENVQILRNQKRRFRMVLTPTFDRNELVLLPK